MSSAHGEGYGTRSIIMILIATFMFGCIAGGVLFLYNLTTEEGSDTPDISKELIIAVRTYGGCERVGCESYQLRENGAYTYIRRDRALGEIRSEGILDPNTMRGIHSGLQATALPQLLNTRFTGTCSVETDGLAFEYAIEYNGNRSVLDTCTHDISSVPFFTNLNNVFMLMRSSVQ